MWRELFLCICQCVVNLSSSLPPSFILFHLNLTHKSLWTAENIARNDVPILAIFNPSSLNFLSRPWGSLCWQKPVKTQYPKPRNSPSVPIRSFSSAVSKPSNFMTPPSRQKMENSANLGMTSLPYRCEYRYIKSRRERDEAEMRMKGTYCSQG